MVKVFGLHSLIADDAEIDCVDPRGRKEGRGREGRNKKGKGLAAAAMRCHAMPVAAGPIHRSHRPLPNLRTAFPEVWWSIILKRRMMRGHDDLG